MHKADARQIEREVNEAVLGVASAPSLKPELSHDEIEEQARMMTSLLQDGAGVNNLEEQFAPPGMSPQKEEVRQ